MSTEVEKDLAAEWKKLSPVRRLEILQDGFLERFHTLSWAIKVVEDDGWQYVPPAWWAKE